jgi:DNA-binding MarR family transcriptional regulator
MPAAVKNADVTMLYLIKQVELAVRYRLDEVVSGIGLTALQYTALTVLERHPGMTSAELARNSFVRAQTMAQMTTFLESRGLVRKEADPRSKRQYLIFLSDQGQNVIDSLRADVAEVEQAMLADFGEQEVLQFTSMLRRCRVGLSGSHPH